MSQDHSMEHAGLRGAAPGPKYRHAEQKLNDEQSTWPLFSSKKKKKKTLKTAKGLRLALTALPFFSLNPFPASRSVSIQEEEGLWVFPLFIHRQPWGTEPFSNIQT